VGWVKKFYQGLRRLLCSRAKEKKYAIFRATRFTALFIAPIENVKTATALNLMTYLDRKVSQLGFRDVYRAALKAIFCACYWDKSLNDFCSANIDESTFDTSIGLEAFVDFSVLKSTHFRY
jgi:hypothetical protein